MSIQKIQTYIVLMTYRILNTTVVLYTLYYSAPTALNI